MPNNPLFRRLRARPIKSEWTDQPMQMSVFRWAGIEPMEADRLDDQAARDRRLRQVVWLGIFIGIPLFWVALILLLL